MSVAAECARIMLWAVGVCAVGAAVGLAVGLPREREGLHVGLTGGMAVGLFAAAAWYVSTACRVW